MKKFLLKTTLALSLTVGLITVILTTQGAFIDYFYVKFTVPKSQSLVLGDSRSMQGIQPRIINEYFNAGKYDLPILNYSFTIAQIAYGPAYFRSLKMKLDTINGNKSGFFLVTVNPWMLSERPEDDYSNGVFFENGKPPHNMKIVDINPNFEYFIRNFNYFHFRHLIRRSSKMHKDGWLEESNLPKDNQTLQEWKNNQYRVFNDFAADWTPSNYRLFWLSKTVDYLKKNGNVFLIRMPIDKNMLNIENQFWGQFDSDIEEISSIHGIPYINFTQNDLIYETYDGNHLDKFGGVKFTEDLCDSIDNYLSN